MVLVYRIHYVTPEAAYSGPLSYSSITPPRHESAPICGERMPHLWDILREAYTIGWSKHKALGVPINGSIQYSRKLGDYLRFQKIRSRALTRFKLYLT